MGDPENVRRRPGDNLARGPQGGRVWNLEVRQGQEAAGDLREQAVQPEVHQTETKGDPRRCGDFQCAAACWFLVDAAAVDNPPTDDQCRHGFSYGPPQWQEECPQAKKSEQ